MDDTRELAARLLYARDLSNRGLIVEAIHWALSDEPLPDAAYDIAQLALFKMEEKRSKEDRS